MGKGVNKGIQVYVAAALAGPNVNWQSADGSFYPLNADEHGNIFANFVVDVSGTATLVTGGDNSADALAASLVGINTRGFPYLFNETTWDRQRNNTELTVLASAARIATINSATQTNFNHRGLHVIINVTAITATPSVVPKIQGLDPLSGVFYDLLDGVAITAAGTTVIKLYPGIGQVANAAVSDILPRQWRVRMEHADADSITYSVGANLVV